MSAGQIIVMNKVIQQVNEYGCDKIKYLYDNMEPAIHKGEFIHISRLEFNELQENDVIIYKEDNADHLYAGRIKNIIQNQKHIDLLVFNDNTDYPYTARINQKNYIGMLRV